MAQRKYDQKLKDDVIQAVIIGDRSAAQVARDHKILENAVYSWIRAYKENNGLSVLQRSNETPEQEIKRSKMERNILKKATAYFASLES